MTTDLEPLKLNTRQVTRLFWAKHPQHERVWRRRHSEYSPAIRFDFSIFIRHLLNDREITQTIFLRATLTPYGQLRARKLAETRKNTQPTST